MARYPTRAERLAAERARQRQARITDPVTLNPPYPYRAIGFDPASFRARRCVVRRED